MLPDNSSPSVGRSAFPSGLAQRNFYYERATQLVRLAIAAAATTADVVTPLPLPTKPPAAARSGSF